ncbi:unnamed protein product [Brassicogethes aeneus]|uniref:Ribosomal protein S6 kinase delta-1 n=1 Tax=Brassicogethes aeneus TaxID=1431903 RepID=A0A9P0AVW6_BRAAE|nr:unnamed protein product [Brassicogethes aeneus]
MVSNREKWMRIFDVPETNKHKNGYTIYKVISLLYPESCPDAVTKVTVWKRFNDFKKLHREVKVLHRKLNLESKLPNLPGSSLFKRFDEETITIRKQSILNFLEYVGSQSQLFTSTEFVKFFETSLTPADHLNSNINLIRADLNLPEEEYIGSINSDDDHTISDTDSITTISSLSPSVQNLDISDSHLKLKKRQSVSQSSDTVSIGTTTDSLLLIDGQVYPTAPQTPGVSVSGEYAQYLIDASIHVNIAVELENDKKYDEAFVAYTTAIDILLKFGKDDSNYDRKQLVRYKTEKYLLRAEKIYNMYLAEEVKNLRQQEEALVEPQLNREVMDLYKYKVIKVICNGMLVLHSDTQQLFYVKVIHKTMEFLNDHLILPELVPYMVKLYNHFNCENALFLILEYCSGVTISDYLKQHINNIDVFRRKDDDILKQIHEMSDDESENSFSELVNDYTSAKKSHLTSQGDELSSSDEFVKVEKDFFLPAAKKPAKNIMDEDIREGGLPPVDVEENSTDGDGNVASGASQRLSGVAATEDIVDSNCVAPQKQIVKWSAQLLVALEKLHVLGITCRDLQMKNLLIDEKGDLKLTYMCNVNELCDLFTNKVNVNLAPEVYGYHVITDAADWWSFGAILYELLVGMPISDVHPNGITCSSHVKIPKYVSAEARSLIKQLLTYNSKDRLGTGTNGVDYLKSHPFFNTVDWHTLTAKYKY